ncbi:metal ABC transporter permease, partial [Haemophilus influenzae]
DKFKTLSIIAIILGAVTSFVGVYISYYLDGATGGVIVTLQTLLFLVAFLFSPKYGLLTRNKKAVENV